MYFYLAEKGIYEPTPRSFNVVSGIKVRTLLFQVYCFCIHHIHKEINSLRWEDYEGDVTNRFEEKDAALLSDHSIFDESVR